LERWYGRRLGGFRLRVQREYEIFRWCSGVFLSCGDVLLALCCRWGPKECALSTLTPQPHSRFVYTSTLDANRRSTTHTVTVKCDYVIQRTTAPTVDYIKYIPITPLKPDALLTYQHHKRTPPPQQYTCSSHQIHLTKNTRSP
jgi:hypothetical protein